MKKPKIAQIVTPYWTPIGPLLDPFLAWPKATYTTINVYRLFSRFRGIFWDVITKREKSQEKWRNTGFQNQKH